MGMLALKRLMSMRLRERRRRRRRLQARNGPITASRPKAAKYNFQHGERFRDFGPELPEDIWCHIHSLMPMEDSARAACVSRTFLRSWRHHPNLILSKETLGLKQNACGKGELWAFTTKIDLILKNHSSNGVKTLKLDLSEFRDLNPSYLNDWLQIAITPRIESLTLYLPSKYKQGYDFPDALLFGENGNSIRYLHLTYGAFRPTVGIGCLRSLTELHLCGVGITGEELGCLFSNSLGLMQLKLQYCTEIICLKIPCVLDRLRCLTMSRCSMLQTIESKAPNLSTLNFDGNLVQLALGQSLLEMKNVYMKYSDDAEGKFLCSAITNLPHIVPNVEALTLSSFGEMVYTPMVAAKFLHLKRLEVFLGGYGFVGYDYYPLVSFLNASPALKTFILAVKQHHMASVSVFDDASHMGQNPESRHNNLKDVKIFGFCSAKSMVELTCHILENATSLECVILDTVFDQNDEDNLGRCSVTPARKNSKCSHLTNAMIWEAKKGLMAIEMYIVGKVPPTVKFDVGEPCSRCHTLKVRSE